MVCEVPQSETPKWNRTATIRLSKNARLPGKSRTADFYRYSNPPETFFRCQYHRLSTNHRRINQNSRLTVENDEILVRTNDRSYIPNEKHV